MRRKLAWVVPIPSAQFLAAIGNPRHKEHESMLEWVGGSFDPEAFDPVTVNRDLAELLLERWRVQ